MNNRLPWDITAAEADDGKVAAWPQGPRSFGA